MADYGREKVGIFHLVIYYMPGIKNEPISCSCILIRIAVLTTDDGKHKLIILKEQTPESIARWPVAVLGCLEYNNEGRQEEWKSENTTATSGKTFRGS
jgi:hypothetical protein